MTLVNFTLRQWGVIAALSAAFIVAAIVVSNDSLPPEAVEVEAFDEIVWCETANAISRWRSIHDGSVDGDTLDDIVNLQTTLDEARAIARLQNIFPSLPEARLHAVLRSWGAGGASTSEKSLRVDSAWRPGSP